MNQARPVLFSAGAGTGKTTRLASAYLELSLELWLQDLADETTALKSPVERILAITFTESAASEMRARVEQLLHHVEEATRKSDPTTPDYIDGLARRLLKRIEVERRAVRAIAAKNLFHFAAQIRADLPKAHIQTIHAFCQRLVKENAPLLGYDPDFTVPLEYERKALLEKACYCAIQEAIETTPPDHEQNGLYAHLLGTSLTSLVGSLAAVIERRRNRGESFLEPDLALASADLKVRAVQELLMDLEQTVALMLEAPELTGKARERVEVLRERISAHASRCEQRGDWQLPDLKGWYEEGLRGIGKSKLAKALNLKEYLKKIMCADAPPKGYFQQLETLLTTLRRAEELFQKAKREASLLDFNDQLAYALEVFRRSPATLARYRREYQYVLVDEYQDVDPLQQRIILSLLGYDPCERSKIEETSGIAWERLFLVGDQKQSIYRFRGADVAVFNRTRELLRGLEKVATLNTNFRSLEPIIRFVNAFFHWWSLSEAQSQTLPAALGYAFRYNPDPERGDGLRPHRRSDPSKVGPSSAAGEKLAPGVYTLRLEGAAPVAALRRQEAEVIASLLQEMNDGTGRFPRYDFSQAAVLLRSFTPLKTYEKALRRACIPYLVVQGRGLYQTQEVLDLLHAVRSVLEPDDPIALVGFLRSPMCALSDETILAVQTRGFTAVDPAPLKEKLLHPDLPRYLAYAQNPGDAPLAVRAAEILRRLEKKKHCLTIAELLIEIIETTELIPVLLDSPNGEQKVANVKKIIELARQIESDPRTTHDDFSRLLGHLAETDPLTPEAPVEGEGVRIMTIHQSKGREFDVVFLADLDHGRASTKESIIEYPESTPAIKTLSTRQPASLEDNVLTTRLKRLHRLADDEERKRLLYVAMTRAKDYLFLGATCASQKPAGRWGRLIAAFYRHPDHAHLARPVEPLPAGERARIAPPSEPAGEPSPPVPGEAGLNLDELLRRVSDPRVFRPQKARITVSHLADFLLCERKYYYTAVCGLDEAAQSARPVRTGPHSAQDDNRVAAGLLVHDLLARLDWQAPVETQKTWIKAQLAAEAPFAQEREEMERSLLRFLESETAEQLRAAKRVQQEIPFRLCLPETEGFRLTLRGTLDALAENQQTVSVIEYKYARRHQEKQPEYDHQLALYLLALRQAFPDRRVEGAFVFLKEEAAYQSPPFDPEQTEQTLRQRIPALVEKLRAPYIPDAFGKLERITHCHQIGCRFTPLCWGEEG